MKKIFITSLAFSLSFISYGQFGNTSYGSGAGNEPIGNTNSAFGHQTLESVIGDNNTGVGFAALQITKGGFSNTAIGFQSLKFNTQGNNNTATGANSMRNNKKGQYNTASGDSSLYSNSTGHRNTASGHSSLFSNTTGYGNTASGSESLYSNTTGGYNTAAGFHSLRSNTTGTRNTALGSYSLTSNTIGIDNTAIGLHSLSLNTEGEGNTAIGNSSLNSNTVGDVNTAIGHSSLYSNETGISNVATGFSSLYHNTQGSENTAMGTQSLFFNSIGSRNTATGLWSLRNNTTGSDNTAVGYWSLSNNTTAWGNTAIGYLALYQSNGFSNVALGKNALHENSSGSNNAATGTNALYKNTTGERNTANGLGSLKNNVTGNCNTALGYETGPALGLSALDNTTALGCQARPTASNMVRVGNTAVTSIGGYADWTDLSDGRFKTNIKENVPGLAFIKGLRPITYNLNVDKLNTFLGVDDSLTNRDAVAVKTAQIQTGFIAQEVEETAKSLGFDFSGIDEPKNDNDHYGLRYAKFVVPLVKAVQELNKNAETQTSTIEELREIVELQQEQISVLLGETQTGINTDNSTSKLFSVYPNPFTESATIGMTLDNSIKDAKIFIYNLEGKEIISFPVSSRGETSVQISGNQLESGTYIYTLIVDGEVIDSKRMILTK